MEDVGETKRWGRVVAMLAALSGCVGHEQVVSPTSAAPASHDVWIRDVTVVSPERSAPLAHAHVVLRDGRILSVGTVPPAAPGATVVDGSGRFLVPGLIDGHVHLAEIPGVSHEAAVARPSLADAYFAQLPLSYLYFGFTTVVDLNVVDRARVDAIRRAPLGPAVLDCGGGVPVANGYPMSFAPEPLRFAIYPNFLHDPAQASAIPPQFSPADHTPRAAVARVAASGGVCVKTFYEPGFGALSGKLPVPSIERLKEVVAESKVRGLPVLLHANSVAAHRVAVAAGADVTAHGMWNWGKLDDAPPEPLPDPIREVVDQEIKAGVGVMPTSRVISGLEDLFGPFLDDPKLADVLPPGFVDGYRSADGQWFAAEMARDFDGAPRDRIRARLRLVGDRGRAAARYFVEHGGRLFFGSDTPSAPTYANPPGYNGYLEMRELERAGIKPRDIFVAATSTDAKLFGVLRDRGTVEAGKRADLLLLAADPLASTAAFDTIETVFIGGRAVPRAELSARRTR